MADSVLGSNHPITNFAASPDEPTTRFHYDALDSLIGRTTSEGKEHRFYRNDELASEVSGTVSTTFVRAEGVVLAECQTGGDAGPILLMGDDKNSVMGEVTRQGLTSIAYSPYGHRVEGSSANSHLGYNGERRETQSGWYFLGNGYRVFNPRLMRFHSPDSLSPFGKGGLNAYMYCVGDPINNVDPTGHSFKGDFLRALPFRKTTASSVSEKILPTFKENPKKRPVALIPITETHVQHLKEVEISNWFIFDIEERYLKYLERRYLISPEEAMDISNRNKRFYTDALSASVDRLFAEKNLGKRRITRHSAEKIKERAAQYHPTLRIDIGRMPPERDFAPAPLMNLEIRQGERVVLRISEEA
ncbi:RHS repeat-associated core domain-containing protein [Pseudomonas sp. NFACC07-1]|uniref:RHS repeat-associated core domain-containing protein n=1 Tax=Pseudomonas sp. NFACC07-1 TaxID=1566239 RepID=UPI0008AD1D7D|nr:RHS repeat-associated core domain-containing protein [Pseudomonas sp. NFACC07-1]SEJ87719.1 RHS repeat-associated core domain-containing protein [Pseudomonas sp. NFACC07-1]